MLEVVVVLIAIHCPNRAAYFEVFRLGRSGAHPVDVSVRLVRFNAKPLLGVISQHLRRRTAPAAFAATEAILLGVDFRGFLLDGL